MSGRVPGAAAGLILSAIVLMAGSCCAETDGAPEPSPEEGSSVIATVVFDNYPGSEGLCTGWGFACHLQLPTVTVLFDTGADGGALVDNMLALRLQPDEIDLIVLSHAHGDHTGGLRDIVSLSPDARVCVLDSFPVASRAWSARPGPR